MDSIESLLTKKLDELELEMLENPNPNQKTLLSKITFLKYLLSAEISAMRPKSPTLTLKLSIAHKNLEQLESLANDPSFLPKFQTKIAFIKSLVADENDQTEQEEEEEEEIKNGDVLSSSCSCTSSCFDGGEKKEEEEKCVYGVDEQVLEVKLENYERRFGKIGGMRTILGFFVAAAAVGVAFTSFFGEKGKVYLVPT